MEKQLPTEAAQDAVIELSLPAQYRYLGLVRACIRELVESTQAGGVAEETLYGVQLAVHEICNNIIEHAYGHENGLLHCVFRARPNGYTFTADLYDSGRAFDMTSFSLPSLEEPQEEGYGLFLAHQLMDEVSYDSRPGKNHWRLRKNF